MGYEDWFEQNIHQGTNLAFFNAKYARICNQQD
jgi:hypothetical protein